jgi:hypothetical protein
VNVFDKSLLFEMSYPVMPPSGYLTGKTSADRTAPGGGRPPISRVSQVCGVYN